MISLYLNPSGDFESVPRYLAEVSLNKSESFVSKLEKAYELSKDIGDGYFEDEVILSFHYFLKNILKNKITAKKNIILQENNKSIIFSLGYEDDYEGFYINLDMEFEDVFDIEEESEEVFIEEFGLSDSEYEISDFNFLTDRATKELIRVSSSAEKALKDFLTRSGFNVIDIIPTWIPKDYR